MRTKSFNKPQFYLKDPKSTKDTKLRVVWYTGFENKPISFHTTITVNPKHWLHKDQKVNKADSSQLDKNLKINNLINNMRNAWCDIEILYRENKSAITNEIIKKRFIALSNGETGVPKAKSFWEAYDDFALRAKKRMKQSTLKVLNTVRLHLVDYERETGDYLSFDRINVKFYDNFIAYLYNERKPKLAPNTVGRTLKTLRTFLRECFKYGICPIYDISFLKDTKVPSHKIALTQADLDKLWNLDVDEHPKYFKVRNLFLLQCYTGMRVSDLMRLSKENIKRITTKKGNKKTEQIYIEYIQEKTGDKVSVPAIKCVPDILAHYPDYNFPVISEQRYNQYIKEVCKLARVDDNDKISYYEGNQRKSKIIPKNELITSHTARRTFVTLCLERGMPAEVVMKLSGQRSLTEFFKYAKHNPEAVNREFIDKWNS
ncbi:MAG: phage integrase SAM-like domain-containing protein [FCB group bacterium]